MEVTRRFKVDNLGSGIVSKSEVWFRYSDISDGIRNDSRRSQWPSYSQRDPLIYLQ